jgi:hypothetical protein
MDPDIPQSFLSTPVATPSSPVGIGFIGDRRSTYSRVFECVTLPRLVRVLSEMGSPIILYLIGRDWDRWEPDYKTSKSLGLLQVKALGHVRVLDEAMNKVQIVISLEGYITGCRTRILSALSYSKVVIAHRSAKYNIPELEDRRNCFVIDKVDQVRNVIEDCLAYPSLARGISQRGYDLWNEDYSPDSFERRFDACLATSMPTKIR